MQDCARHAFAAVQDKLNPSKHKMTFELYGLDFMIDLSGKVQSHSRMTPSPLQTPTKLSYGQSQGMHADGRVIEFFTCKDADYPATNS